MTGELRESGRRNTDIDEERRRRKEGPEKERAVRPNEVGVRREMEKFAEELKQAEGHEKAMNRFAAELERAESVEVEMERFEADERAESPRPKTGGELRNSAGDMRQMAVKSEGSAEQIRGGVRNPLREQAQEVTAEGPRVSEEHCPEASATERPSETAMEGRSPEQSRVVGERAQAEVRPKERVFPERPTVEELDRAIRQHPHFGMRVSDERYREAVEYCQGGSPQSSEGQEIRQAKPTLIDHLERQENARLRHEMDVPPEAKSHRVPPEIVREVIPKTESGERLSKDELIRVTEELYKANPSPEKMKVHYVELYQVGVPLTQDRLREVSQGIHENRAEIEQVLNQRLGLVGTEKEVRVAVYDDRLCYWTKYAGPDGWLNVLAQESFYFKSREAKLELVDETIRHLHIRGGGEVSQTYLDAMLNELSRLKSRREGRIMRYGKPPDLEGETIHFISDVLGMSLEDLKPRLSYLGMRDGGRIYDLKFPDIHAYRMKFAAIIDSDGYYALDNRVSYYEKNPERQRIAVDVLREFGYFRVRYNESDPKRVDLPRIMTSLAEGFGIPRGDKGIHNQGLHESIIREPPEVKAHYLPEVVAEEGSVSVRATSIVRHSVLHGGVKADRYERMFGIKPVMTREHIDFICEHGMEPKDYLCYKKGDVIKMYISKLKGLTLSDDETVRKMAIEVDRIISANTNRLLESEVKHIAEPLGIEMKQTENYLLYYRGSKRLALASSASTATVDDYVRLNLIGPPNHPKKMSVVVKSLRRRHEDVLRIREEIIRDGLRVSPVWEEYDLW